jgi:predicted esterase
MYPCKVARILSCLALIALPLGTPSATETSSAAIGPGCFRGIHDAVTITTSLSGVPAILRVPSRVTRSPIVLWHGFGPPDSEEALMTVLPLDDVPAIKVYVGLPLFGKRGLPGGKDELIRRQKEDMAQLVFKPIVLEAANELPAIVRELMRHGCMSAGEKIGLFGFSAGGASVLISVAEHEVAISSAVVLNPSTGLSASIQALEHATGQRYVWTPESRALAERTDAIDRVEEIAGGSPPSALLILQGRQDVVIAPEGLSRLADALTRRYAQVGAAARFRYATIEELPHNLGDPVAARELNLQVTAWFNRYE